MKRMIASSLAQAQAAVGLKPPHEIEVVVYEAANLRKVQALGQQDPYVFMYVTSNKDLYHATKVCKNTDLFGKWDETFRIACNALSDKLVVEVRDRTAAALGSVGSVVSGGKSGDVVIGRCQLPLSSLLAGAPVNGWFALDSGGGVKLGLKLVSSMPGSVPMSYAAAPLPVLSAAPGSGLATAGGKTGKTEKHGAPAAAGPYPQQMTGAGYPQQQTMGYGGMPAAGSGGGGAYPSMPGGMGMEGAPGAMGGVLPYAGHPGPAGGGAGGQQPYMAGIGAYPYPAPAPGMPAMGPGGVAAKATYPSFPMPGAPSATGGAGGAPVAGGAYPPVAGAFPSSTGAPAGSAYPSLAGMPGAPASTAGGSVYPPAY